MTKDNEMGGISIERGSGNVYADLGRPDAEEMLVKAGFVSLLMERIQARGWSRDEAAEVLGLSGKGLEAILNGQFRGVSADDLQGYLRVLGE